LSIKPCITNQQINSIVPFKDIDNEYLYYAILNMVDFIKSTQSTNTLPIINKTDFSKFRIFIPSLPEQTKIANFLSAIDANINHCGMQIEKMEGWKKGLLQRMFV
jgi:type I restriction enzyme S subunit